MTNNKLFNEDTIRLRCAGCGKLFDITEMKQCSACKQLFCTECQKTHDCTEGAAAPAASAPASPKTPLLVPPAPAAKENRHTVEMTDDEAYSAYVREINPFIECEECGESYPLSDMWKCPDCGIVLCQICREKHRCPKPENGKWGVLGFIPLFAGKKAAQIGETGETDEGGEGEKKGTEAKEEEEEPIVCDGCGKSYPKSKMRKCQNCGAVLCPRCRIRHSCAGHGDKKGKDKDQDEQKETAAEKEEKREIKTPELQETKDKEKGEEKREIKTPEPQETRDKEKGGENPETKEPVPQSTDAKGKKEEEEIVCDSCGKSFPRSKMRKCRECGDVLCPKCRKKHVCRTKEGET